MKLLVVEDERRLAQILAEGLLEAGYLVEVAFDGVEGQALALTGEFDVIILDLMLPRRDGLEICRRPALGRQPTRSGRALLHKNCRAV